MSTDEKIKELQRKALKARNPKAHKRPSTKAPDASIDPTVITPVQEVFNDAMSILAQEVGALKRKIGTKRAGTALSLTTQEAAQLQKYVRSIVELSREARELEKAEDLSHLDDQTLLALFESASERISQKAQGPKKHILKKPDDE